MSDKRTKDELADFATRLARQCFNSSPDAGWHGYEAGLDEISARLRSMPEGERIEGWATRELDAWVFDVNRPHAIARPATLILQHREDKSNKPTHVCGLQGFDLMKGDVCPKCEQEQSLREGKSDEPMG